MKNVVCLNLSVRQGRQCTVLFVVCQYRYIWEKTENCLQNGFGMLQNLAKIYSVTEIFVNINIPFFAELLQTLYLFKKKKIHEEVNTCSWCCQVRYAVI